MSSVPDINQRKVSKGRTVGNSRGNDRNPSTLTAKEEFPKSTSQEREESNAVLGNSVVTDLKPKLVQALTQDLGQGIERGTVRAKRSLIKIQRNFGVTTQTSGIADSFQGRIDLGVDNQPFEAALQVRAGTWFLEIQGIHEGRAQAFEVFLPNDHGRNGMHCTRPCCPDGEGDLLLERTSGTS